MSKLDIKAGNPCGQAQGRHVGPPHWRENLGGVSFKV